MEAAGWIKKSIKELSSQVISAIR